VNVDLNLKGSSFFSFLRKLKCNNNFVEIFPDQKVYITWLLRDIQYMMIGWVMTSNGDLRGIGGFSDVVMPNLLH
jgi:hypothetical protein